MGPKGSRIQQITRDHNVQIKFPEREDPQGKYMICAKTWRSFKLHMSLKTFVWFILFAAPPAEATIQENGEANGEVKEPVDPNAPKKCDVIVISGRKERCDNAVEALKVWLCSIYKRSILFFKTAALFSNTLPSSGLGSCHYRGGSAFWASSIHHWTERKWNSQDDGWIWGSCYVVFYLVSTGMTFYFAANSCPLPPSLRLIFKCLLLTSSLIKLPLPAWPITSTAPKRACWSASKSCRPSRRIGLVLCEQLGLVL